MSQKDPKLIDPPCLFRGPPLPHRVSCVPCAKIGMRVELTIYSCGKHGNCTLKTRSDDRGVVPVCVNCSPEKRGVTNA